MVVKGHFPTIELTVFVLVRAIAYAAVLLALC